MICGNESDNLDDCLMVRVYGMGITELTSFKSSRMISKVSRMLNQPNPGVFLHINT